MRLECPTIPSTRTPLENSDTSGVILEKESGGASLIRLVPYLAGFCGISRHLKNPWRIINGVSASNLLIGLGIHPRRILRATTRGAGLTGLLLLGLRHGGALQREKVLRSGKHGLALALGTGRNGHGGYTNLNWIQPLNFSTLPIFFPRVVGKYQRTILQPREGTYIPST